PRIRHRVACLATLLGILAAHLAAAEPRWTSLGPPAAPTFARLQIDPADGVTAYALTTTSLWRSRGGPGSWRSIQVGLDGLPLAFAFDPRRPGRLYTLVYEPDGGGSVRRSDDFGGRWSRVFAEPSLSPVNAHELRVDPFAPDTLYWLTDRSLRRSRDAGRTWECFAVASDCAGVYNGVNAFTFAPDRARTMYAVSGYDFYVTHDGGATWTRSKIEASEDPLDVVVATRAPRTLYGWSNFLRGELNPCFVRSDDEGATWKAYLPQAKCSAPAIDLDDPLTVRIVVVEGGTPRLRVSHDGGESWSSAGAVPDFGDLYVLPGGELLLATGEGVFRAAGDAGSWRPANHGFAASEVAAVLPIAHGVAAAPAQPSDSLQPPAIPLLLTEDGGRSWRGAPLLNPVALAADPGDPHRLIASAWRYEPNFARHARVLESLDDGHTWRGVVDPQTELPYVFETLAIDPFDERTLYAGNDFNGLFRSEDGGRSWQTSNAGLRLGGCHHYYCDTNRVSAILPDPGKSGAIAILFERQVYASDDGGITWKVRGPVTPRQRFGSVAALARDADGALVAVGDNTQETLGAVYRSTDGGATWKRLGRLPRLPISGRAYEVTALAATPAGLFVGTNITGVLRSTDGGRTWSPFNKGLPLLWVTSLAADPGDSVRLYATAFQNGIYVIQTQ
ncbi:MAG TPA: hypothetical protein VIC28_03115, partial [Thermoanaerobaculia bacterium]